MLRLEDLTDEIDEIDEPDAEVVFQLSGRALQFVEVEYDDDEEIVTIHLAEPQAEPQKTT